MSQRVPFTTEITDRLRELLSGILGVVLVLLVGGCQEGAHHFPHHVSVLDQVEADTAQVDSTGLTSEEYLQGVKWVRVQGHPERLPFNVAKRLGKIEKYPCQECHNQPLSALKEEAESKKAHWNVTVSHAAAEVMTCTTCHAENAMNELRLLSGTLLSFNHSYQLCAQCHAEQATDWAGGAHGKRKGGWAPPRVINNCTDCHDPHDPDFEPRWPARASRLVPENNH